MPENMIVQVEGRSRTGECGGNFTGRRFLAQSRSAISAIFVLVLAACGGAQNAANESPKENARSQHVLQMSDVPELVQCLSALSATLRTQPNSTEVSLHCVAGIYRGETSDGRICSLKIDDDQPGFQLQVEREKIGIRWEKVAYGSDGMPIHNLQDSSATGQPGIQLTRYTGALAPVTEALILRADKVVPATPKMIYLRTEGNKTTTVRCIFGK